MSISPRKSAVNVHKIVATNMIINDDPEAR